MKKTIVFLLLVIFIGNFLFPFLASAGEYQTSEGSVHYEGLVPCGKSTLATDKDGNVIEDEGVKNPCELCHLFVMLDGIIDFVLLDILPWIVILMILIAGIMFYFAGGNPNLLLQAKKLIWSVVIGLTIILCAYLIVGTILTVLGVQSWTTLDKWAGEGSFQVICPIGGDGANNSNNNGTNDGNGNGISNTNGNGEEDENESKCEECGAGFWNLCDKDECLSLGDCEFHQYFGLYSGFCEAK